MKNPSEIRSEIRDMVRAYHEAERAERPTFRPGADVVRYAGRVYDADELINLVEASLDFWLTAGPYSERFESGLAEFLGVDDVLIVNSGSSANLVALTALTAEELRDRRIKPGDEVITVAAGFPTTVNPIIQNRAVPVFVDVELGTYVPRIEAIEAAISPRTRAVALAHTMGVPFPVAELRDLCDRHGLWLIEDNCDALGSRYGGRVTGSFGDFSTCSFYPAHHITMGEGGAVATRSPELARIARSIRDWGRDCHCAGGTNNSCGRRFSRQFGTLPRGYDHKYVYSRIGYNLKATDLQAAVGVAQLAKLPAFTQARRRHHAALHEGLRRHEAHFILHTAPPTAEPSWFGYVLTVRPDAPFDRSTVLAALERARIETRNLFSGNVLRQPAYQDVRHRVVGTLDNADTVTSRSFFVGVYPGLTDDMIRHVLDTFDRIVEEAHA